MRRTNRNKSQSKESLKVRNSFYYDQITTTNLLIFVLFIYLLLFRLLLRMRKNRQRFILPTARQL